MLRCPHLFSRKSFLIVSALVLIVPFSSCTKQPATPSSKTTSRAQTATKPQPAVPALATVPFISCPSDGQQGPQPAPVLKSRPLLLNSNEASQLAYFEGQDDQGVLAPKGRHCLQLIGSSGEFLYVSPTPITADQMFSSTWKGFTGPAIQLSVFIGDTSGRFEVAKIVARVFPKYKTFVTGVIKEQIESASDFPFGPWPHDQLHYLNDHAVEFTTPANTTGLGTSSRLLRNAEPISGVAIFFPGSDNDLTQLSVRLPPELAPLSHAITHQVELESGLQKQ